MTFLKSYKPFFNIYLLLGVCPFRINLTKNTVHYTITSWCYTILLFFTLSYALVYFAMRSFYHEDFLDSCDSGTCNYVLITQSLIIFVLFLISSIHTVVYMSDHILLLNGIVEMEINVLKHLNIEIFPNDLVRNISVRNSLFALLDFILRISAIYCLEINQNLDITIYHYLLGCETLIINHTVAHVITICSILKHSSELLLNEIKQLIRELTSKNNDQVMKIYQIFYFLDNINEFKVKICSAFGIRLLINQSMDFVFLTVAVYYFILVNLPIHFEFHWLQVYFLIAYVFPVVFKNVALVVTADSFGNQVSFK